MAREQFSRFYSIYDMTKLHNASVEIIGLGAIGGWAGLLLAKSGIGAFTLWDMDKVAHANIGVQPYSAGDLDLTKTMALSRTMAAWSGYFCKLNLRDVRFTEESKLDGSAAVTICAVDSAAARKTAWRAWLKSGTGLFLDTRMGAEEVDILAVGPGDSSGIQEYAAGLEELIARPGSPTRCTEKATSYCGAGAASVLTACALQYISGGMVPPRIQSLSWKANEKGWNINE